MLDHIVLHAFGDEAGALACAVVYDFSRRRYLVFNLDSLEELKTRIFQADWISGFNLIRHDYPLILGDNQAGQAMGSQFRPLWSRTNDLAQRIMFGVGISPEGKTDITKAWTLEATCRGTLSRDVTADEMAAMVSKYLKVGNWAAGVSLALDHACAVVELVQFVERHGFVVHGDNEAVVRMGRTMVRSPLGDSSMIGPREEADYLAAPGQDHEPIQPQ